MKIIIKMLAFGLAFGVGNLIRNAVRGDNHGVELAAITSSVITGMILILAWIDYGRCGRANR